MAKLSSFNNLNEKQGYFKESDHFIINSKADFDVWFDGIVAIKQEERTNYFFRGMKDAKHRLYTSAQRIWIENDMAEWSGVSYHGFIDRLIAHSLNHPLLRKVFDVYGYNPAERQFPILSILQHYGAPTPFMDWSYNVNVSLFFGTETLKGGHGNDVIDNYFSIYMINKADYKMELLNIRDFIEKNIYASFNSFSDWGDDPQNPNKNGIFYISDFDEGNAYGNIQYSSIQIRNHRPFTSIFNQNIIPQEGLFIFNPFVLKSIDEVFNVPPHSEGSNLVLTPFHCFNIKKDLAEYVRRRIKNFQGIDSNFIYPHLYDDTKSIINSTLNSFIV